MSDYNEEVTTVLEEHENDVREYVNGSEAAMNFLVGQLLQETAGVIDPVTARDLLRERIESHYRGTIDWPIEVPYYLRYDHDAIAEKMWNVLRDMDGPTPEVEDVPDVRAEPEVGLPVSIEEDGTVHLGRGKAVDDDELYRIPYTDRYNTREKVEECGIPDTDEAHKSFKYMPQIDVWYEWNDQNRFDPVEIEIENTNYLLVEK